MPRNEGDDGRRRQPALDGPRGPARVAQPGALFLAGATGHPILPFHIEADRAWTAGSWDRTQVPKPFSNVAVAIGEPISLADTTDAAVEEKRVELERVLALLETQSMRMLKRRDRSSGEIS